MKLQEVIDKNYVVELPQKWMFNEFCEHLGNLGMHWCSGRPFKDYSIDRWSACKEETCVNPSKGDFGHLYEGYTKVKFLDIEEFSFKVGDKVKVTRKWNDRESPVFWNDDLNKSIDNVFYIGWVDLHITLDNGYAYFPGVLKRVSSVQQLETEQVENSDELEYFKLKVGDKVRILGEPKNSQIEWLKSMDKYIGIESIISDIDYKDSTFEIEGCGYWFPFECLEEKSTIENNDTINYQELIGKNFLNPFNTICSIKEIAIFGDKVRVINKEGFSYNFSDIQIETKRYK